VSKDSRSGGKFTGNHTTLILLAALVCDIANDLSQVTKISPGFIKSGLKPVNGHRRVKFTDESEHCILLSIRDNISHQEVHIYVTNLQVARTTLARKLRDADIAICFN
jgi:hypothetical protein